MATYNDGADERQLTLLGHAEMDPAKMVTPRPPDPAPGEAVLGAAEIDATGAYRYRLDRVWDLTRPLLAWIMLNPSTANAETDDATIRSCMRLARVWGYGRIVVGNLYAWRATDPEALVVAALKGTDIVGPGNDEALCRIADEAARIVAGWGAHKAVAGRESVVLALLRRYRKVYCAKKTKDGHPGHPLYVRSDAEMVELVESNDPALKGGA
jgi:hypothetical protein